MALYFNSNLVVDNYTDAIPVQYSTRANLPSGSGFAVQSYISYVTDQQEFVVNYGNAAVTTGLESSVVWQKFQVKPMDYKNEVVIQQGVVANGYVGSSIYNTVSRVIHALDLTQLLSITTPFTSKYGGWHSTWLYAYFHQGNNEGTTTQGAAKMDWATQTMTTLTTRPSLSGQAMNSTQPGPKVQNTFGVLLQGTAGCYFTFTNDTWTSSGYATNAPSTNYGWATFDQNQGYQWNSGNNNVYTLNWGNQTWSATSSGNPPSGGTGNLGKALNSKWQKFYHCGDAGTQQSGISKFNNTSLTWSTNPNSEINPQCEHGMMMGQDWGYLLGGYGPSGAWAGQNAYSQKIYYVSDTLVRIGTRLDGPNALSSSNACWGPIW